MQSSAPDDGRKHRPKHVWLTQAGVLDELKFIQNTSRQHHE